jgi:hypothetical protein
MNPVGFLILLVLLYYVGFGARRPAALAMLGGVLYLTQGQAFDVGINLFAMRILGIALFARALTRHEFSFSKLHRIDRLFLILYAYTAAIFLIRSRASDLSTVAGAFDAVFCYFGFRGLIKGQDDLRWLLRKLVILLIPYALLIAIERYQGRSVFIFMGGLTGGWEREGSTRCMAAFRYPVALGIFAASFLALYIGLWFSRKDRRYAYAGIGLCLWFVVASNSGGSLTGAGIAVVAWFLWYQRKNMRAIRWGIAALLVVLAFVMKAPVWYVLDRVSFGGDSWHRAYLIDVAMRNLGKWWLVGMDAVETANWFPYTVNGAADITNQYLVFGINAGIVSIGFFIALLSRAYGQVGKALARIRLNRATAPSAFMLWGLGAMLTVHLITWFGVSYFDQVAAVWFLQLAALVSVTEELIAPSPTVRAVPAPRSSSVRRPEPAVAWS